MRSTHNAARSFFSNKWPAQVAALAVVAAMTLPLAAQEPAPAAPAAQTQDQTAQPQDARPAQAEATLSNQPDKKKKKQKVAKSERVVQSKDTRAANKRQTKLDPLAGKDASLPDKVLYDKALYQTAHGHFDVARLDLQTLLNTYPDSQYQMRAKLAIADSWFREGGSAALTQAEQEYLDFITFFPNVPEAAEAQMRVGDIYFKQMDVPDRDYQKTIKAEEAYRLMIKQYPDSPLVKDARQKLREVQEVLAIRESELGLFYAQHENWPASIARYQTVADTYPLYSHMDDVLIGLGDAYAAEAKIARAQEMPEGAKAKILATYDNKAAEYYRTCVLEHSAAAHVEDCKERLESMGRPIPTPTPEQAAASEALEGSRAQYTFQKRMRVLITHSPDTVTTARVGDPPLDDVPATVAPTVTRALVDVYKNAFNPNAAAPAPAPAADGTPAPAPTPDVPTSTAPLKLQDVPGPGEGSAPADTATMTGSEGGGGGAGSSGGGRNSVGVEVLTPGVTTNSKGTAGDASYGLKTVGNTPTPVLPAAEKPAEAPDQVNEAAGTGAKQGVPATTNDPNKKKPKPAYDKEDESSSKHKKKKGLDKLNPF